jgi:hypothetical protein
MRNKPPAVLVTAAHVRAVQKLTDAIEGLRLSVTADWASVWREPREDEADPLAQLDRPGLWKGVMSARLPRCVFEVPLCVVDEIGTACADGEGEGDGRFAGLEQLIEAAQATKNGRAPAGWTAPADDELAAMVPADLLTVQCAEVASQGRVTRSDERLAVEFPIATAIPKTLAAPRRKKLAAVLVEANDNWRMVRVGLRDGAAAENTLDAIAQLDLTAMPHASIEPLLRYGIDALHHVVVWAAASAAALVESPQCELLDD